MVMPNPMRGEAEFGAHKLVVTFNGFCALEAATGIKMDQLVASIGYLGALELRTWIRVFLDSEMAPDKVGELIGELGLEAVGEALTSAVLMFLPPSELLQVDLFLAAAKFAPNGLVDEKSGKLLDQLATHWKLPKEAAPQNPPKAE